MAKNKKETIELRLRDILMSRASLSVIGKEAEFDMETSFKMAEVIKQLDEIILVYNKIKQDFFNNNGEYCEKDKELVIKQENGEKFRVFQEENQRILDVTHTIEFEKIPKSQLELEEGVIDPNFIAPLFWLIDLKS